MRKLITAALLAGLCSFNVQAGKEPSPGPTRSISGGLVVSPALSRAIQRAENSATARPVVVNLPQSSVQALTNLAQSVIARGDSSRGVRAIRDGNVITLQNVRVSVRGRPTRVTVILDTSTGVARVSRA